MTEPTFAMSPIEARLIEIRPIETRDDAAIAAVIRTVMPEFGATGCGFAINDPEVDWMSTSWCYSKPCCFRSNGIST